MMSDKIQASEPTHTELIGAQVWVGRGLWIVVALLSLVYFIIVWAAEFQRPLADCLLPNADCNPIELSTNDIEVVQDSNFPVQSMSKVARGLNLATNAVFLLTALLIFWRRANNRVALFVSGTLIVLGAVGFSPDTPDWLGEISVLNWLFTIIAMIGYVAPLLLLFFFPDGRFVPSWSRFIVLGIILFTLMNMFLSLAGSSSGADAFFFVYFVALAVSTVIGIGCVIYRYRRIATLQQQQQLKWVALGFLCATSTVLLWLLHSLFFPPEHPTPTRTFAVLFSYLFLFTITSLFPICVMIAILRYRLFDIDILIRRTLVYSLLTGLLALTYFGSVVLLQAILGQTTGERSPLVLVLSTLLIAGLFAPLRGRVQNLIDRRFYRQKYDAAQVLARFAQTARDEVEMEQLAAAIIHTIEETIHPETVSIWIKPINKTQS